LFSRFDWSIFVTQLVAKHMKEILIIKNNSNGHYHRKKDDAIFTKYII
jgi:hypothetical protein